MKLSLKSLMPGLLVGLALAALTATVVFVVLYGDRIGLGGSGLGERFDLDPSGLRKVDPALVRYERTGTIRTGFARAGGIAVGPVGRVYVVGDQAVRVFDRDGTRRAEFALSGRGQCLAVAPGGRIYVGVGNRVDVLTRTGEQVAHWAVLAEKGLITSIAASDKDVFLADYASRTVGRYDVEGNFRNHVLPAGPGGGLTTFTVPSPYFDVALTANGKLIVAHSGAHRIETYDFDGAYESGWGFGSNNVEGFAGCCNPSHLAVLADGRVVTSEKGLPTVKVYSGSGELDSVVATAEMLARVPTECSNPYRNVGMDVAVDAAGRVLVLDPAGNVGIFTRRKDQ